MYIKTFRETLPINIRVTREADSTLYPHVGICLRSARLIRLYFNRTVLVTVRAVENVIPIPLFNVHFGSVGEAMAQNAWLAGSDQKRTCQDRGIDKSVYQ